MTAADAGKPDVVGTHGPALISDLPGAGCGGEDGSPCRYGMLPLDCETLSEQVWILVGVRWFVVAANALLVAIGWLMFPGAADWGWLSMIVALLGISNIHWWRKYKYKAASVCKGSITFASRQILVDFVLLALAIQFTGGIGGPLTPLFVLHSVFASIMLPKRYTVTIISSALLLCTTLYLMDKFDVLRPVWKFDDPGWNPSWVNGLLMLGDVSIATAGSAITGFIITSGLRKKHLKIALLATELAEKNEELRKIDEQRVALVSVASHDLKSPLTAVEMKLDVLAQGYMGDLTEKQRAEIFKISERLSTLRLLINDLLDITAIQMKGRVTEETAPVDVSQQVRDVVSEMEQLASSSGVRIDVSGIPTSAVLVMARPRLMKNVWMNLVSNAVKYGRSGKVVKVTLSASGGRVSVGVTDFGMGISQDDQKQLFSEFFRTAGARASGVPGTGLGLSIVKNVVEGAGGTVAVESEPGKGSTFTVSLPLMKH